MAFLIRGIRWDGADVLAPHRVVQPLLENLFLIRSRNLLLLNEAQAVLLTKPDDAKRSSRIVGSGEVRLSNGDVLSFGGAPKI